MVLALALTAMSGAKPPSAEPVSDVMRRAADHRVAMDLLRETTRSYLSKASASAAPNVKKLFVRLGLA